MRQVNTGNCVTDKFWQLIILSKFNIRTRLFSLRWNHSGNEVWKAQVVWVLLNLGANGLTSKAAGCQRVTKLDLFCGGYTSTLTVLYMVVQYSTSFVMGMWEPGRCQISADQERLYVLILHFSYYDHLIFFVWFTTLSYLCIVNVF